MFDIRSKGRVAVIEMQHGKANALDAEFCAALTRQFEALRDADAAAVVIASAGRMFSAGVDLPRAAEGGADYLKTFVPILNALFRTIFFFPKPVVAAVNGHAIAGGCVLACCADRRFIARDAGRMGVTELLVGLPFPGFAFEVLRYATAPARFPEFVFSGATFEPDAALACGFVDEIVAAEELLDRAVHHAETLAALRPEAFALSKKHMRRPVQDWLDRHAAQQEAEVLDVWLAPETITRIRDYVARTFKKS